MTRTRRSAFTLIELLCVTAIIGILASMLLGAVSRAFGRVKRFEWEQKSDVLVDRFRDRMKEVFGRAPKYPAMTVEQLYQGGLIDSNLRDFLKDRKVDFFPFSSAVPEEHVILTVYPNNKRQTPSYIVTKGQIVPKD